MNKYLNILFIILVLMTSPVFAGTSFGTGSVPDDFIFYKQYMEHIINDKAVIFNALNLSDSQREKFEEITQKNTPIYKQKLEDLLKESYRLKALKSAKFGFYETHLQRKIIKNIEKEIAEISLCEDKELYKILNFSQRSKYRNIKHLERHDSRKEKHPKDYYKSNPQMPHFGCG